MDVEIRGQNNSWTVWYPNEGALKTPVPVYDREGIYTGMIYGAGEEPGWTEAHYRGTWEGAVDYARKLVPGCTIVRRIVKHRNTGRDPASV